MLIAIRGMVSDFQGSWMLMRMLRRMLMAVVTHVPSRQSAQRSGEKEQQKSSPTIIGRPATRLCPVLACGVLHDVDD